MTANAGIEYLISQVLGREGGFVNHPNDRGGPTNYGITQGTLAAYRRKPVSVQDVVDLTVDEARAIYRQNYFQGIDAVTNMAVLEFLFDYSVNSGNSRAVKALQKVLGVPADGVFGPVSRQALALVDQSKLLPYLICERLDNYLRIIGGDHSQAVFANGWANRIKPFWSKA